MQGHRFRFCGCFNFQPGEALITALRIDRAGGRTFPESLERIDAGELCAMTWILSRAHTKVAAEKSPLRLSSGRNR